MKCPRDRLEVSPGKLALPSRAGRCEAGHEGHSGNVVGRHRTAK